MVDGFLGKHAELTAALKKGIRVLDIGCGTGHALNLLAEAYPNSTFVGYDLSEAGIEQAQSEAKDSGLSNVTFAVKDVTHFPVEPPYDLIMAFDTIHDLAVPDAVLQRSHEALTANGPS